jgi:hypothetical protein
MSRIHPCDRANFRTVDDGLHTQLAVRDQGASFSPMSAIGTKQTSASAPHMSAFDPKQTCAANPVRGYLVKKVLSKSFQLQRFSLKRSQYFPLI